MPEDARETEHGTVRFDRFVFDRTTGELRPAGEPPVVLRPQLASLLDLLLSRPGQLVTRAEIQRVLWEDRALDVDRGINFCIRQLREALGDDAKAPRFIETLPRQGYRFRVPVEPVEKVAAHGAGATARISWKSAAGIAALAAASLAALVAFAQPWWSGRLEELSPAAVREGGGPEPVPAELAFERGRHQIKKGMLDAARESFQEAVTHDPSSVAAWAQLSASLMHLAADAPEHFEAAEAALERTRELAPGSAIVHLRTGDLLALRDRRWEAALSAYEAALGLDPRNNEIPLSLALVLTNLGRWSEATRYLELALELDPLDMGALSEAARIYGAAGEWEEMRRISHRILELEDRSYGGLALQIRACLRLGLVEEAREAARLLMPRILMDGDGLALEKLADFDPVWERFIEKALKWPGHRTRAARAIYYALLGGRHPRHREAALEELEEMASSGTWILPYILPDPSFESLAGDPRFLAVLERAGLEPLP